MKIEKGGCQSCGKPNCDTLVTICKQIRGEFKRLEVCMKCYNEYQRELEMTRQMFYLQYGEK